MTSRASWLVLGGALAACGSPPVSDETRAREAFLRTLAEREGVPGAWALMSRSELVFEDGFSLTELTPGNVPPRWSEIAIEQTSVPAVPVRWMSAESHLLVRGQHDMHLALRGQVHAAVMATRPRLSVSFDGLEIASLVVDPDGRFAVDTVIPATWLHGWSDVYLRLSSVHEPWRTIRDLRVARLESVTWAALP